MPTHPTEKVPFKEQVIGTLLVYLKFLCSYSYELL